MESTMTQVQEVEDVESKSMSTSTTIEPEEVMGSPYVFPQDYCRFFRECKHYVDKSHECEPGSKDRAVYILLVMSMMGDVYTAADGRWMKELAFVRLGICALDKALEMEDELTKQSEETQMIYQDLVHHVYHDVHPFSTAKTALTSFLIKQKRIISAIHHYNHDGINRLEPTYERAWQHIIQAKESNQRYPKRCQEPICYRGMC